MEQTGIVTEKIAVTGIVQGVGFRPFVHTLAGRHRLNGYVLNTPDGVVIEVTGPPRDVNAFAEDITGKAPPLSHIVSVDRERLSPADTCRSETSGNPVFEIRTSSHEGRPVTLISPDVATCDDCLRELFDPADRRYLYPFINCTNCGPRFTIIRGLPYDRPQTTMASFTLCPACRREYDDPADRRFHAQPNACPECGPRVTLLDGEGEPLVEDPIPGAIRLLREGNILAVRGLGGFHLVVDGTSEEAVGCLRERKHREEKPLALMTGSLEDARRLMRLTPAEEEVLASRERPILLAPKREDAPAAPSVAPGNAYLGVMLPSTPLHYLLFYHPGAGGDFSSGRAVFPALVMTSGNQREEPICRDNDEAVERLRGIADAFLVHDRDIHVRSDDSVVTAVSGEPSFVRRSRGYAPLPVFLPESSPPVLALGAELKNTVCVTEGRRAFMSQHIGDLENVAAFDFFREAVDHFKHILDIDPRIIAYDLHPRYLSTRYFREFAETHIPGDYGSVGVQHHHAHIASVLAEYGRADTVIGFSMDGTGFGPDGTVWGGEVLIASPGTFVRAAHLVTVPMPGGERAVREHWRMAFSWLRASYGDRWGECNLPCLRQVPPDDLAALERAVIRGVNCPPTSSLGRLFDTVTSLLDIRQRSTFEGQGAIELDLLAAGGFEGKPLPWDIFESKTVPTAEYPVLGGTLAGAPVPAVEPPAGTLVIDFRPTVRALVEEIGQGTPASELARRFHETLMTAFLDIALRLRDETGIATVALSGGCWQNRIMSALFPDRLHAAGFEVLSNRLAPVNDGGVSLGQAYIASSLAHQNGIC